MYNVYEIKIVRNKRIGIEYNIETGTTLVYATTCVHKDDVSKISYHKVIRQIGDKCIVETVIGFKKETFEHLLPILILIKDKDKVNSFVKEIKKHKSFTIKIEI